MIEFEVTQTVEFDAEYLARRLIFDGFTSALDDAESYGDYDGLTRSQKEILMKIVFEVALKMLNDEDEKEDFYR